MKSVYLKPVIGLILIVIAASGMFWWENYGRENFLMEQVMVVTHDIQPGSRISEKDFEEVSMISENVIKGSFKKGRMKFEEESVASQFIPKNSQVCSRMIEKKEKYLTGEKSIFMIQPDWIAARSASLRRGDSVGIYDERGEIYFGDYYVAYVKDDKEMEIENPEKPDGSEKILERKYTNGVIADIEIIAELDDYLNLRNAAENEEIRFLIVQRGNKL